jgi:hypothetical protein
MNGEATSDLAILNKIFPWTGTTSKVALLQKIAFNEKISGHISCSAITGQNAKPVP